MVVDDAVVIEAFADVGSKRAEFGVLRKSRAKVSRLSLRPNLPSWSGLSKMPSRFFVASSMASIASGMLISSVSPMNAKVMW